MGSHPRTYGEFMQVCLDLSLDFNLSCTSAWRTPAHNATQGGHVQSKHLPEFGWGADLVPDPAIQGHSGTTWADERRTRHNFVERMLWFDKQLVRVNGRNSRTAGASMHSKVVAAFKRRGIVCVVEKDHFHVQWPKKGESLKLGA